MLKRLWLGVLLLLTFAAMPAGAQPLRVMTFNVRVPLKQDGANDWEHRRDLFVETVRKADPDIFGTQELHQNQGDYVVDHLKQYGWFGIDRRGGHDDEHMGVFYRLDRLKLLKMGNFWLSETPDVPGSISWGHPYPRMVTWGLFERRADGKRFYFFNTHFPYRAEDEAAREKAAALLASRIAALPASVPVVLTGDFNTTPDTPTHADIAKFLTDARTAAAKTAGPDKTFHNFTGNPDRRIDWIWERGFDVLSDTTITTHRGKRYPSDHFPVEAIMTFK